MNEKRHRPRPRRRDELHDRQQDLLLAWSNEVCNSEEVPEVEIVSLLQEHIPKYRLRADSLTQFGGYENQDWFIPSPALPVSSKDLELTPDQIRETLNYFLLCSNRVSQMTKTYNDIEAVTRLLEEKEKDLELTARIGKELLTANGRLEARVTALEGELKSARDHITQLRHDLNAKTDLLQVLTNDTEEGSSPVEQEAASAAALRRRTGALERENRALREEASRLAAGADTAELAEQQLLRDIAHQLSSANSEASALGTELIEERQRSADLQHQLDTINSRLVASERNYQQLTAEHEHTLRILEITKENQNALAAELADTKERYMEVAAHLAEAQEQLRALRRRNESRGLMPSVAAAAGLLPPSLHREMHSSIFSELSLDSGIGDPLAQSSMHKVFETVQCASRWSGQSAASLSGSDAADVRDVRDVPDACLRPPHKPTSSDSFLDDSSDTDLDDLYPGGAGVGVPGAPGAAELAAALRRLTPQEINSRRASLAASHVLRHKRHTGKLTTTDSGGAGVGVPGAPGAAELAAALRRLTPQEINSRRASLAASHVLRHKRHTGKLTTTDSGGAGVGVPGAPGAAELAAALRRLTPQEINSRRASLAASHVLRHKRHTEFAERESSSESAVWGAGGAMCRRTPHKLQIVKPLEGSLTLHTWAQLAKPSMSGLLEDQEGVGIRGSRASTGLGLRLYRLSDVEEDDDMPRLPHSSHVYSFVNSTVLHPNDGSLAGSSASSVCSSGMSSLSSSVLGSAWSSRLTSRRSSARGSPERSRRESLAHWSPTATPANSPLLGSPDASPPPTPRAGAAPSLHALIASGTSFLRHADGAPSPIALQTPGSLYTGLVHRSPMEQLTCLKRTLRSPGAPGAAPERRPEAALGVPAAPGSGALEAATRARPAVRAPRPRADLGTVSGAGTPAPAPTHSAFGSLSILFGRKGGLL